MANWILLFFCFLFLSVSSAEETYHDIPFSQRLSDVGIVYGVQWVVYGITQQEVIQNHGKFSNMLKYPTQAHFDEDGFDYNLIKHAVSGHYYYLFYRYRGYDRRDAFLASFVSSMVFEFAVETYTERPSYQDMYQTPVFGTVLGIGAENLSNYLLEFNNPVLRALGYLFNPFKVLPWQQQKVSLQPLIKTNELGVLMMAEF